MIFPDALETFMESLVAGLQDKENTEKPEGKKPEVKPAQTELRTSPVDNKKLTDIANAMSELTRTFEQYVKRTDSEIKELKYKNHALELQMAALSKLTGAMNTDKPQETRKQSPEKPIEKPVMRPPVSIVFEVR